MARLLLLNGPNLNLLGAREPETYGAVTLQAIEARAIAIAAEAGHELVHFQSNAEHELIDRIQQAPVDGIRYLVFNPAGFTHTSIALRDAISAVRLPFIEVHLSNTQRREPFRRRSYFSDIADGVICGLGAFGYELAMRAALHQLTRAT